MQLSEPQPVAGDLARQYTAVRNQSLALAEPLTAEDCCAQSMPDASPVKWHLAHTSWFFETFVLARFEPRFAPFDEAFKVLFNSYYHGIGPQHARPRRGLLTRPALARVLQYRGSVDERMLALLETPAAVEAELRALTVLGLHHEQQHQELMLTDIKHLFSCSPLLPTYAKDEGAARLVPVDTVNDAWISFDGGIRAIGADNGAECGGFCFDNELPRHDVLLRPYQLAARPVSNGEYLQFIADGGYREPLLWLSDGWDWLRGNGIEHPLYWMSADDGWREFSLRGMRALAPHAPVVHLSYYEVDAYARWAGARLPTEAEWECAAAGLALSGNFVDGGRLHPMPGAGTGLRQMFGDVWEWTSSSYAPYPGFLPAAGAVGEYNAKFMVNQYVLRGGSCATPQGHVRASYRNFFPPGARWQFSGLRLAKN